MRAPACHHEEYTNQSSKFKALEMHLQLLQSTSLNNQNSERVIKDMMKTMRIELQESFDEITPQVNQVVANFENVTHILDKRLAELIKETKSKDAKILELTSELSEFKGREDTFKKFQVTLNQLRQ